MRLDNRFHGTLIKNKDGREIPEDEFCVFTYDDLGIVELLGDYYLRLVAADASSEQVEATHHLINRVAARRVGCLGDGDKLDLKVHGVLVRDGDGEEVSASDYVVFRPHDDVFVATLPAYRTLLAARGAGGERLAEHDQLYARVCGWRAEHGDRCKLPDVEHDEIG